MGGDGDSLSPDEWKSIRPFIPSEDLVGRITACLGRDYSTLYRVRVPRNGLWWEEDADADLRMIRDVWVEDEDIGFRLSRYRPGDWVRVRKTTVQLEPPVVARPGIVVVDPLPGSYANNPLLQLRFPDPDWLDAWFQAVQLDLCLEGSAFRWPPPPMGSSEVLMTCSCGEIGCASLWGRIESGGPGGLVTVSEITFRSGVVSRHLGPMIGFAETDFRNLLDAMGRG